MATIINVSHDTFIAGDPPSELPEDHHWCLYCLGDGLETDDDGDLTVCAACDGACSEACDGCGEHPAIPTA